jgi:hypothetical protein
VTITRGGEKLDRFPVVEVVRPRIVLLCVDGLGDYWFRKALDECPDIAALFGKSGSRAVVRTAHAVLPSITWANWAGVFTGKEPKDHGVYGNSFFRRDMPDEKPVFSGNDFEGNWWKIPGTKDGGAAVNGLFKDGLSFLLRDGVETLYEKAKNISSKPSTVSALTWYSKGAGHQKTYFFQSVAPSLVDPELVKPKSGAGGTSVIIPQIEPPTKEFLKTHTLDELNWGGAAGALLNGHETTGRSAQYTDAFSVSRLIETWRSAYPPDLTAVYLPGPDNYGHAVAYDGTSGGDHNLDSGNRSPYDHFVGHTARWLRLFHERYVDKTGWSGATIYLLVSDHGQTKTESEGHQHTGDDDRKGLWVTSKSKGEEFRKNLHLRHHHEDDDSKVEQLVQVVKAVKKATENGLTAWMRRDDADHKKFSVVFSPNGGLAYIYVSGGPFETPDWSEMPQARVRNFAEALFQCASGTYAPAPEGKIIYPEFKGALGPEPVIVVRDTPEWEGQASGKLKVVANTDGKIELVPLQTLDANPHWVNTARRIDGLDDFKPGGNATRCPDIILIMNTGNGWNAVHEGDVLPGWHGGPSKADSLVPFALGFSGLELEGRNDLLRQTMANAGVESNNPTGLQNRHMHDVVLTLLEKLKGKP